MSIADIANFIQPHALTALGGQPSEEQFRDARDAGYEVVVNLAPDGLPTSLPDERGLLASLALEYHHIPVRWAQPLPEQLDAFTAVMGQCAGRRTLIHCQVNFRVTAFYALYAMDRLGWSRTRADALIDRVWTTRPGYVMDETWARFIREAAERISA